MKKICLSLLMILLGTTVSFAQNDHIADGLSSVASMVGEANSVDNQNPADSAQSTVTVPVKPVPLWKQKLYYGYNFDIYFHHDSRSNRKENGWSINVIPEIGWRLKERVHLGLRLSGGYQDMNISYTHEQTDDGTKVTEDLRVRLGKWEVTPYARYKLKSLFNEKVGIWIEGHLFTGMEFPRVAEDGKAKGTDYDGLRHTVIYGAQVAPVITYQFNKKSTFQIFFSIISFGYSGSALCYVDSETGVRHNEYTNDIIIFSGKLSNLLSNQFTPGLYGLRFGVQKSF